jgi:hypothetical protein
LQPSISITIQLPSKKDVSHKMKRNDTIASIKQHVCDEHEIAVNLQQVLHGGMVMRNDMEMQSIDMVNNDNHFVVVSVFIFCFCLKCELFEMLEMFCVQCFV